MAPYLRLVGPNEIPKPYSLSREKLARIAEPGANIDTVQANISFGVYRILREIHDALLIAAKVIPEKTPREIAITDTPTTEPSAFPYKKYQTLFVSTTYVKEWADFLQLIPYAGAQLRDQIYQALLNWLNQTGNYGNDELNLIYDLLKWYDQQNIPQIQVSRSSY